MIGNRFRLYPDDYQAEILRLWIGHQRYIYNAKVQEQNYWYIFAKKSLSLTGQSYSPDQSYSQFRNSELNPWLDWVPPEILRNGCYKYMSAYQRFRKGLSQVPVTQSKYGKQSVLITSELFWFDSENDNQNSNYHTLYIGNAKFLVGKIKFKAHKKYNLPKTITISVEPSGAWYLSFNAEEVKTDLMKDELILRTEEELLYEYNLKSNKESFVLGLDRGIKVPVATSQGKLYELSQTNQERIAKKELKIKRFQRKLARQKKHNKESNNQCKTKLKIGKLKSYINQTRDDFCHQVSRNLVNQDEVKVFVFENLKLANMVKKPKPKKEVNVNGKVRYLANGAKAKAGLNRSLNAAVLGRIKTYVQYKAKKVNKLVLFVNPAYSSQECSKCHHIDKANRPSQSLFKCIACGHAENADLNASQIIQQRGIQFLANYDAKNYNPKSQKTIQFRRKSKNSVGQELPEFKPVERLSAKKEAKVSALAISAKQETSTKSRKV